MSEFVRRTRIGAPAAEVYRWHTRPGALERLTPPWMKLEVLERTGGIANGTRVVMKVPVGPTSVRWVAEHRDCVEGVQFRDVQIEGPFARWEHTHRFAPDGASACILEDRVEYELPLGPAGQLLGATFVRGTLEQMFAYRHRTTVSDLSTHTKYPGPPLHVAVTGASGLVGSALIPFLTTAGHRVTRVVRSERPPGVGMARWDPARGSIDAEAFEGLDAVVHLSGESVVAERWSESVKARILESRTRGTSLLCRTLARLRQPPQTLISASAIGYYGDRGAEILREDSAPGEGFLADVCRRWETATQPAEVAGIRVVLLRIGLVLSPAGGALAAMLTPFRFLAGGRLGSGRQFMSWISIDDLLGATLHVLRTPALRGPVNAVASHPLINGDFARILGKVLGRPALVPVPAAALRLALGEMANEMLLASQRVDPARLLETEYTFRHIDLESALRHVLGR
jgi:uncharacterized protein (TIGR01777 family)